jgi:hypothetical protein
MKILKIVIEVVEGQKLTLTGEQLEGQLGLKRDIIDALWGAPEPIGEEGKPEATNVG